MGKQNKKLEVGNLYDLNKQAIAQLPPLKEEVIQDILYNKIYRWFSENSDEWFMLLCREKADYTLFHFPTLNNHSFSKGVQELEECIKNRGIIMSINKAAEDAWEIWIKDYFNREISMYMLFECGPMVIEV